MEFGGLRACLFKHGHLIDNLVVFEANGQHFDLSTTPEKVSEKTLRQGQTLLKSLIFDTNHQSVITLALIIIQDYVIWSYDDHHIVI